MKKLSQISIVLAVLLIGVSFAYYFVARPIMKDRNMNSCLKSAEEMKTGFPDHRFDKASEQAKQECFRRF